MTADPKQEQGAIDKKTTELKPLPSEEEQQDVLNKAKKLFNPDGQHPEREANVEATFGYIMNALHKINGADDKQKASDEIANDLKQKFEGWKKDFEKKAAEQKQVEQQNAEKTEEK